MVRKHLGYVLGIVCAMHTQAFGSFDRFFVSENVTEKSVTKETYSLLEKLAVIVTEAIDKPLHTTLENITKRQSLAAITKRDELETLGFISVGKWYQFYNSAKVPVTYSGSCQHVDVAENGTGVLVGSFKGAMSFQEMSDKNLQNAHIPMRALIAGILSPIPSGNPVKVLTYTLSSNIKIPNGDGKTASVEISNESQKATGLLYMDSILTDSSQLMYSVWQISSKNVKANATTKKYAFCSLKVPNKMGYIPTNEN